MQMERAADGLAIDSDMGLAELRTTRKREFFTKSTPRELFNGRE
jgi:hypothetical protein